MRFLGRVLAGLLGALAFGLAFASLAGALAANGGAFSDWLDIVAHFTPIWLAMAVAAGAASLALPRSGARTATRWMAALGAAGALFLMAPELWAARPRPAPPEQLPRLKIIQFNSWSERNRDLEATVDWLYAQRADIIVMEEVEKPLRDLLERRSGYHLTCDSAKRCEVAILSRRRPIETGVTDVAGSVGFPIGRVTFDHPGGPYTVVGVHQAWPIPPGRQQRQGVRIAEVLTYFPRDRLILSGDFNSTPWSYTRRRQERAFGLERRTRALFSWPRVMSGRRRIEVPLPFLPIDHVYAGRDWRTVSVTRGPKLGSDHYPVIAVLALASSADKPAR